MHIGLPYSVGAALVAVALDAARIFGSICDSGI
jgi:hypothetical protein